MVKTAAPPTEDEEQAWWDRLKEEAYRLHRKEGLTFKEIALQFDTTAERVRQLEAKWMRRLRGEG